jgi:hypothetical protein
MMMEAQIAIAQSSVCRVMVHLIVSGCVVFFETKGNVVSLRRDDNSWSLRLGKRLQWAKSSRSLFGRRMTASSGLRSFDPN